jgi:hypothetical protein
MAVATFLEVSSSIKREKRTEPPNKSFAPNIRRNLPEPSSQKPLPPHSPALVTKCDNSNRIFTPSLRYRL